MPGDSFAEREAARKARMAARSGSVASSKPWYSRTYDFLSDIPSGISGEASDIYNYINEGAKKVISQTKAGDYPGAMMTLTDPITKPFRALSDPEMYHQVHKGNIPGALKVLQDPGATVSELDPWITKGQAGSGLLDIAGLPASKAVADVQAGHPGRAVGRGLFAAGTMAGAHYAPRAMGGIKAKVGDLMEPVSPVGGPRTLADVEPIPPPPKTAADLTVEPNPMNEPTIPYRAGKYGINQADWAQANPLLAVVPDSVRPPSPTESWMDRALPSRTKELINKPLSEFTEMGKREGPTVEAAAALPEVEPVGATPKSKLPTGTIAKLRKAGIPPEHIASMDIATANEVLKQAQVTSTDPKVKVKTARAEAQTPLEKANPKQIDAIRETIKTINPERPFENTRDADLEYLASKNVAAAIRELQLRRSGGAVNPRKPVL